MNDEALNLLLVEDDPDTRANLCDVLELDQHRVSSAGSFSEALRRKDWSKFYVVILDRRLPDGTVEEFLPEIRRLAPGADVIVITGYADLDGTITALRHGVTDYILKPINVDALRASLKRIAERRQLEIALHGERELAERIIETSEAVVLVVGLDGKIKRFNPFMESLTGFQLKEVIDKDWIDVFFAEQDRQPIRESIREQIADDERASAVTSIVTKSGSLRHVRWSITPLKDDQGTNNAILAIGLDITELLDAQHRSLQSERLAAIGQTMAALAHESRNALQRIQAGIAVMQLELDAEHTARNDLETIDNASHDLQRLLDEVQSYSAPINLDPFDCNLSSIWRQAWQHLAVVRKGRDAEIREETKGLNLVLSVDAHRIEQVFRNLFENSLAACADPVRIDVVCSASRMADKDGIQINVRDNGPGLSVEQRRRVFDAFFTTKKRGTGLGMAIAERIVRAHGGDINVGTSGAGAEFIIHLPRT